MATEPVASRAPVLLLARGAAGPPRFVGGSSPAAPSPRFDLPMATYAKATETRVPHSPVEKENKNFKWGTAGPVEGGGTPEHHNHPASRGDGGHERGAS